VSVEVAELRVGLRAVVEGVVIAVVADRTVIAQGVG
jgi:hypothetical protein